MEKSASHQKVSLKIADSVDKSMHYYDLNCTYLHRHVRLAVLLDAAQYNQNPNSQMLLTAAPVLALNDLVQEMTVMITDAR